LNGKGANEQRDGEQPQADGQRREPVTAVPDLGFLAGGGELGALMRGHDWTGSPLGPPAGWPQSLRTAVSILINSRHPMFVAWGPELAFLYNDGYRPILAAKHPAALGRPFHDVWPEIWPDIYPLIERALGGDATWSDDLRLVMERSGHPEETYFTFSYSLIRNEEGGVGGMFCACTETTSRVLAERRLHEAAEALRASERALREERDRLHALFEHAPGFVAALEGPEHRFALVNQSYRRLVGDRDLVGRTVREALPDVEGQGFFELLDRAYATGEAAIGRDTRIVFQASPDAPPEERYVDFIYQPVRERNGTVSGILCQGTDVTDRVLYAARQRLLLDELNHRVKNNLAAIQSIAAMTARGSETMLAFQQTFQARLTALARTHDVLARNAWEATDLGALLAAALRPFGEARIVLRGPEVLVSARQASALGMIAHELAANAAKYGALSTEGGRVEVTWDEARVEGEGRLLRFEWCEFGGPAVAGPPVRRGFGSRLIERSAAADLGGTVRLDFRPEGLCCSISAPLGGPA
jgi:PAS domain S-box-containing protein